MNLDQNDQICMATANIKCPKCGNEFNVVPEDLDGISLHYDCPFCNEDILVDFFDYCPTCNKIVGFLEGDAFKNDMATLGKTIGKGLFNPLSAVGTIGGIVYASVVNDSKNSIGNGICPYCNLRFIKCHSCHELTPIPQNATFTDSFKCRNCGVFLNPNGSTDECGRLHSKSFYNSFDDELHINIKQIFTGERGKVYVSSDILSGQVSVGDWLIFKDNNGTLCGNYQVKEIEVLYKNVQIATSLDKILVIIGIDANYEKIKEAVNAFKADQYALKCSQSENGQQLTEKEQEYLDNIREFFEDDAEITPRERKMLDRIRQSLGISEERAKELEASLAKPQLTEDEQEYIEAYREYLVDGSIDEKSRKRLDIFRKGLGISEERATELEKTIK